MKIHSWLRSLGVPSQLPNLLDNVTMIESNYDNMQGPWMLPGGSGYLATRDKCSYNPHTSPFSTPKRVNNWVTRYHEPPSIRLAAHDPKP